MPEGDTLFVLAAALRPVLAEQTLVVASAPATRARAALPAETWVGRRVRAIETRGKHLLVRLDDDTTLHVHLGMTGKVRSGPRTGPGALPAEGADLVLETATHRVVGRALPVLEHLTAARLLRHPQLAGLGPDLLADDFDADALTRVVARYRREPFLTLGEALLDQRLACGVGNVYKSEALFLAGLDPWQRVGETGDEVLAGLVERARGLMRRNLDGGLRRTRQGLDPGRYFVYERQDAPCRRCDTPVAMARQGEQGRSTYFCSRCQGTSGPRGKKNEPA